MNAVIYSIQEGFNNILLSQVCVLFQGQERGWGASDCSGPAHEATGSYIVLMTSSDIATTDFSIIFYVPGKVFDSKEPN